jgi:hypothetical protein
MGATTHHAPFAQLPRGGALPWGGRIGRFGGLASSLVGLEVGQEGGGGGSMGPTFPGWAWRGLSMGATSDHAPFAPPSPGEGATWGGPGRLDEGPRGGGMPERPIA